MHQIDLNGAWQVRWYDGQRGAGLVNAELADTDPSRYLQAQVPGEIHVDLMRLGILADTNDGANVLAARWVEETLWTYRRAFEAPDLGEARAWLVFDRLFLHARIVLNGREVATHGNAFRPCRVEVTGLVRPGLNVLAVHLESGLFHVADKPGAGYAHHEDAILHKRAWLRAPQCQFGWDWSPRLMNVGISGDVRLEWTPAPTRLEAFVPLVTLTPNLRLGHIEARFFLDGPPEQEVCAQVELPELGLVARAAGTGARLDVHLDVPSPEPWWPIGAGQPKLYTLRATLQCGEHKHVVERQVGFRHVEWDQSPHPERGTYFRPKVNGRLVFCKGANFVPADTLFVRIDRERTTTLIDRALEANFNFLRIWGGGLYESDDFYELCDQRGVLVWQEFIYACSRYPMVDGEFHEEAKREARYQVRRLASHPSLVAWCGNNEMEEGNWHWGYDEGTVLPDYGFFHLTLPRLMLAEDPTRHYQPSSPLSPGTVDPRDEHTGDQHPWTLGFFDLDTRKYRKMECRFPNEGGVMGPTTLPTLLRCLAGGEIGSFAWQVHDNSIADRREPRVIDGATQLLLGKPMADMSPPEFMYWAGLLQAEGLKEYIENFRRRAFDSACAVFWMFNDTWPAARSWTIVDYELRRTPSFEAVRRAFEPIQVVLAEVGDQITVFGLNDTDEPCQATLSYGVIGLGGDPVLAQEAQVRLEPNASTALASFPISAITDPTRQIAVARLAWPGGERVNRLILPLWSQMAWPDPEVQMRRTDTGLELTSSGFVPALWVHEPDRDPYLADLHPGWPLALPPGTRVERGLLAGSSVALQSLT